MAQIAIVKKKSTRMILWWCLQLMYTATKYVVITVLYTIPFDTAVFLKQAYIPKFGLSKTHCHSILLKLHVK